MKRSVEQALRRTVDQAEAWGLHLMPSQQALLGRYADVLAGYDRANVIGTRDADVILSEHVADALSCVVTGCIVPGCSLVDVGSGGGLPGIPLGIAIPGATVTLIEAASKKVRFLESAVEELGLANVRVVRARAEEAGREKEHREAYDVAVARAVAALPVVLEYCAPLVKTGGSTIAMRAGLEPEEMDMGERAAAVLVSRMDTVTKVEFIPAMVQKERNLVVFRKEADTPLRFPRRAGLARQRPLARRGER